MLHTIHTRAYKKPYILTYRTYTYNNVLVSSYFIVVYRLM